MNEPYGYVEQDDYMSLANRLNDELSSNVDAIKGGDSTISVDSSDKNNPVIKVNVDSAEGNIITVGNNGLYATVGLSYNAATNSLSFTTSNGVTEIPLLSNSLVDEVSYDPSTESIVIKYTVDGKKMDDIVVPVSGLIEEWNVDNSGKGAVSLTKVRNVDGADKLSASVVINETKLDNAIVNDNGTLYVSKDSIRDGLATLEDIKDQVEYINIATEENPNRKAVVLANHDTILGTTTSGSTVNLAMLSKWDKADFGSTQVQMNLNSKDRVQVNDTEEVAYVSDVDKVNSQFDAINIVKKGDTTYELQVGNRIGGTVELPTVKEYTAGNGISLASDAFSLKIDTNTQDYVEVSSEGLKIVGVDEALAKKVEWMDVSTEENPNRKSVVLNNHDTLLGKKTDGAAVNIAMVSKWDKVDLGSAQVELNLNGSAERPTYNDEKEIALIDDIDALVESVEVNIPIRSLSDKIYDKATILGWFGVEDEAALKGLITREGQFYLKYGITLSYNPHFYRMPIQYVAFESAEQIKLVFVGLDTSNDVASKYEIVMNLDETVIEGNSNVKMTITPIDEETDLSAYATVEALSNEADAREAKDAELEKSFNEQIAKKGMYYPSVKVDTQKLFALTKASSEDDIKAALQLETASGSYTLPTAAIFDDCLGKGYQLLSNWMPVSVAWNGAAYVLYVVGQSYMMQPTGLYTVAIRITAEGQYSVFQAAKFEEFATVDEIPSVSGFITSEEANAAYQPKGEYVALTDSKDIILPLNGSVTMIQDAESGTGGVVICQRNYGSGNVTEVSNVRNLLTLNAKERPQVDLEGGVQEKIAYLSEINKIMDSIIVLNDKVNLLQNKVDASFIAEAEKVEDYDGSAELNDETKSYVIDNATISNDAALTANAVTLSNAALDADTKLAITANSADINGLKVNGGVAKTKANATITANNADFITFKDMTFNASNNVYNGVEIGLNEGSLPKNVLFENCRFEGEFSNNAILIFGTQDNATITLNNCYFESVSNALRLSNRTNATGVTVNIINCTVGKWDARAQYGGFLILEDYTSKNVEEVSTNNLFGNGKITVNFSNLVYNGNVMMPLDIADVCGTQDSNQIIYVYADQKGAVDEYNVDIYPIVAFR